jgi:hypothetical protein
VKLQTAAAQTGVLLALITIAVIRLADAISMEHVLIVRKQMLHAAILMGRIIIQKGHATMLKGQRLICA